jgi:hypothetical protein
MGAAAGSTVLVEVGGRDLGGDGARAMDARVLHFDHPGLKAEYVKPGQFRVSVAADTPAGFYELHAVGRYGISASMLFAVSRGLTEVLEKEPNDSAATAQRVPMNVAINGHSDNEGDDYFRFPLKKGERVVLDCQALRLDSPLRATLVLSDADGKELARSRPYYLRTDPLLDFIAPKAGDYIVRLHDTTFAGGRPYRLIISNRPHVENAFPAAVRPGETVTLTVLGRNLPGAKPADGTGPDRPLERITVPFTMPSDSAAALRFDQRVHLTPPSLNARGLQAWPKGLENALNPVTLAYATAPVVVEREPNDTAETAQEVKLPATVCGRLDKPGDADWYTFPLKAGESIEVDLLCERLDFPGDLFVIITDAKGNEVAQFDDHGMNFNNLNQFNRDPLGTFTAPAAGKYRLFVQDRYRNGGPRYQYVLHLGKPKPDFYPVVIHELPLIPICPTVRQGGSAFVELCLNRRNFNGFVVVEADGLPRGVTCPPVHVSPQTQFANVVFTAAADAKDWAGAVRLKAWAVIDGKRLERPVRCAQQRVNVVNTSRVCREICLAVRPTAPYALTFPGDMVKVAAGGAAEANVAVRRQWADFKGLVRLNGLNLPPGFDVAAVEVPGNRNEATVKFRVAGNVLPGTYSLVLRGDAQVPFARDAKGPKRNVRVADSSGPLTVVVTPPPKK